MAEYVWPMLILANLFSAGLVACVVHSRRQQQRVHDTEVGVDALLLERFSTLPTDLRTNFSHDLNWPVLVFFAHPDMGILQRLQFSFAWAPASLLLIADDSIAR